ncbi:MAG TPA: YceI family protein [Acidimicrobiales bacterium]|jgi:polyisoprenoid-binding protein YceI
MSRRRRTWTIVAAVTVVLLVAAGVVFWWNFLRDDSPPPVALSTSGGSSTSGAAAADARASADGDWQVAEGDSFAGYRVTETFAGFGSPSDAVGRSPAVEGTLTVEGTSVPEAQLEVDMTQLRSDTGARDAALRGRGLETSEFPTATFRLTEPVDLGGEPTVGEAVEATATGDLTLHGTTQPVDIPIEAVWTGDRIEVVGSLELDMRDYGIEPPTTGSVVSIEPVGILEFQLFFEPAA